MFFIIVESTLKSQLSTNYTNSHKYYCLNFRQIKKTIITNLPKTNFRSGLKVFTSTSLCFQYYAARSFALWQSGLVFLGSQIVLNLH